MDNNKNEIKIVINGEEYDFEISEPLNTNNGLEQIDGKWCVVYYPEGAINWDEENFFLNSMYKG